MKCALVFDDWRNEKDRTVYCTPELILLTMGEFHVGTTFSAEIKLSEDSAAELQRAIRLGFRPIFRLALPIGKQE